MSWKTVNSVHIEDGKEKECTDQELKERKWMSLDPSVYPRTQETAKDRKYMFKTFFKWIRATICHPGTWNFMSHELGVLYNICGIESPL